MIYFTTGDHPKPRKHIHWLLSLASTAANNKEKSITSSGQNFQSSWRVESLVPPQPPLTNLRCPNLSDK